MKRGQKTRAYAGRNEKGDYRAEYEARAGALDDVSMLDFRAEAGTRGLGVGAYTDAHVMRLHDERSGAEGRFLGGELGVDAGLDPDNTFGAMGKARLNLADCQAAGFQVKLGLGVSTGVTATPGQFEAKVAGVGFKVGRENGLSVFDNEFSYNVEKGVDFGKKVYNS